MLTRKTQVFLIYNLTCSHNTSPTQTLETVDLPWAMESLCVEVWPHPYMKHTFTILVLCAQYLLPLIVLPVVHAQVCAGGFWETGSGKIERLKQNVLLYCARIHVL